MKITFDPADLRELVREVVGQALDQTRDDEARLGGQLAFTEPQAACRLGLPRHSLRDARLRGEIEASRVGKRVLYSRESLLALLKRNRI